VKKRKCIETEAFVCLKRREQKASAKTSINQKKKNADSCRVYRGLGVSEAPSEIACN